MNWIKKKLSIFIIIYFLTSCSEIHDNTENHYSEILIDNTKINDLYDISDMVEKISFLPLKESPGNYIGDIDKLYVSNNKYIVFDWLNTHKVNLYDSSGLFIKTIIKIGDSPGDALQLNDCWLNFKNELEVYDWSQKKIYQFDSSFLFKGVIKSKEFVLFKNIKRIPNTDKYVGYATFDAYNAPVKRKLYHIALMNKEMDITNTDYFFDKKFEGVSWLSYQEQFCTFKDTLRFIEAYNNFIYNVTNSGITKRFYLRYKNKPLPDDVLKIVEKHIKQYKDLTISPTEQSLILKDFVRFNGTWLENEKYIYIASRDEKGQFGIPFFSLIDKKTNNTIFNTRNFCETKKYKLILPPFRFYDDKNGEFISVVDGSTLKQAIYKDSYLLQSVIDDPEVLYLIKVKLK